MQTNASRARTIVLLTVALSLVVLAPANAYIDAGSVSLLFQGIVAGLAAAGMFVKLFWRRIANVFRRGPSATEQLAEHEAATPGDQ